MEKTTLYYRQGSSDKIYQASIQAKDGQFVVTFAYGRRGTTLQVGTKTQAAVPLDAARAIYEKLIKEKMAKGYTVGENGAPYQHSDKASEVSGINCQLLNPIEEAEAIQLVNNPAFAIQEKYDGRRLLIRKTMSAIEGINRNGLIVSLPTTLVDDAESLPGSFILDGECVGEEFMAFDLLFRNERDIRTWPFRDRYMTLLNLISIASVNHIQFAETAFDAASKAAMLERLRQENKEGVVFKDITAPYVAGRPSTGGDQMKWKFYSTASFIVSKVNGRRSVELSLHDRKQSVTAGNVTIPPNHQVPKAGAIVEVRYLYAFKSSGCVYQPVYLGERDDINSSACTVKQLKWKAEVL